MCHVEALDSLVLDAVLGVHIGTDTFMSSDLSPGEVPGCEFVTLSCTGCQHELGRCYSRAPPEIQAVVPEPGARRYVLRRSALQVQNISSQRPNLAQT